jgi:hypothetical protein
MVFSDLLASIATATIAVLALLALRARFLTDRGRRGELVRYFGVAALSALACAALNILEIVGGGAVAAAAGNATNVFAPALLWAGARRVNGRATTGALAGAAVSLLLLAVTFVIPLDAATLVKTALIAVFCVLAGGELRRGLLAETSGAGLTTAALWLFALFNTARLVVAATAGMTSWTWSTFASAEVTSVVSAVTILFVTVGAIGIGRHLDDAPAPGTAGHERQQLVERGLGMLDEHGSVDTVTLRLTDLDLIRAAHGIDRAAVILETLQTATREAFPDGYAARVSRDSIGAVTPPATSPAARDVALLTAFSRALRTPGNAPEVRISHRRVGSAADVAEFAGGGVSRPTSRDRWRSGRTGTRSAD